MGEIPANLFDKCDKSCNSRDSSTEKLDTSSTDNFGYATLPYVANENEAIPVRFRRTGSERLKDGAKAFLRRVESIKSRRRKRQNRDGIVISGPQELDLTQINNKFDDTKCGENLMARSTPPSPMPTSPFSISAKLPAMSHHTTNTNSISISNSNNNNDLKVLQDYTTPKLSHNRLSPHHYFSTQKPHHKTSQSTRTSPLHFFSHSPNIVIDVKATVGADDSSSCYSDVSQESSGVSGSIGGGKKRPSRTKRFLQRGSSKVDDIGAMSDSECHHLITRNQQLFKPNFNGASTAAAVPGSNELAVPSKLQRGSSLNLGKESQRYRDGFKSRSFRSRSSCRTKEEELKIKSQ